MNEYEEKIKEYMKENNIKADHLSFQQSCHSVEQAAKTANAKTDEFVKNICMLDSDGNLIVAIVKGEDRASTTNIAKVLNIQRPRIATPKEILEKTGYPCGGTPSFGYDAISIIDSRVMEMHEVYSGGGSENSLIRICTPELQKANSGIVAKIRK